jgi:hypothetical protein
MCGTKVNHATFMRRSHEEKLIDPKRVVQLGLRGSRFGDDDVKFGYDVGYTIITLDEYEEMGRKSAIEIIQRVLGEGPVYISLDIDGIDPAYAPGTAVPEIGGLIPRDVQVIIRSLAGKDIILGVVDVAWVPSWDLRFALSLDGLATLYALLATCIGLAVLVSGLVTTQEATTRDTGAGSSGRAADLLHEAGMVSPAT